MKRLRVRWRIVGLWRDECDGSWYWDWPKFSFTSYRGRPGCVTRWLYDWWLDLGVVSVALRSEEETHG